MIERTCKVMDCTILEIVPADGDGFYRSLHVVCRDVDADEVLQMQLTEDDLKKLGIEELSGSKGLIDLSLWLRSVDDLFTVTMPEGEFMITVQSLLTKKPTKKKDTGGVKSSDVISLHLGDTSPAAGATIKRFGKKR